MRSWPSCFPSHAFFCTKLLPQLIYISLCFLGFSLIYNSSFGDIQSSLPFFTASLLPDDDRFCKSSFRDLQQPIVLLSSDSAVQLFLSAFALCFNCVNKPYDLFFLDKFTRYSHCSTLLPFRKYKFKTTGQKNPKRRNSCIPFLFLLRIGYVIRGLLSVWNRAIFS